MLIALLMITSLDGVPAIGAAVIPVIPLVAPLRLIFPAAVPFTPKFNAEIPSVLIPATVFGTTPAPPPNTGEFAASNALDAIVVVPVYAGIPPDVPLARPVPPPATGKPVALVRTRAEGVPSAGVTSVGLVPKTSAPEPVSSVTAEARFAELGVARNVATPVPNPETPVEIGKPVAFVSVPDVGVPRTGVTNVGLVANTSAPLPVSSLMTPASCADVVAANCDKGEPVTPHVGHAIVPVVVIVPPVMGEVVAMLVTLPVPHAPHEPICGFAPSVLRQVPAPPVAVGKLKRFALATVKNSPVLPASVSVAPVSPAEMEMAAGVTLRPFALVAPVTNASVCVVPMAWTCFAERAPASLIVAFAPMLIAPTGAERLRLPLLAVSAAFVSASRLKLEPGSVAASVA